MMAPSSFRRRTPSSRHDPTQQEKQRARQQRIRALEHMLGGSVGWGFDTLCRQLSRLRRESRE